MQVRDELEKLLDDDDDMDELYLSRKLVGATSSLSGSAAFLHYSPSIGSKPSRASRASVATALGDENDVGEVEMLVEVNRGFTNSLVWFCFAPKHQEVGQFSFFLSCSLTSCRLMAR